MEQKKILWIIAAAGVFLLVVLGAACILYSPAAKPYSTVAKSKPAEKPAEPPKNGWTNPPVEPMAPSPNQNPAQVSVNDLVVLADNATVYTKAPDSQDGTTIDLNALKKELYEETSAAVQPQNINITVNIPENTATATTTITTTPEYKPEEQGIIQPPEEKPFEEPKSSVKPKTKPAEKAVATKSASKPKAAPAPAPAAKKAEAPKVTQFWVQVAAYSNKKGAETARTALDNNKIPADIFTFQNKDKLYYRVRVGPYTTKSEAEYWRSKILKIDDFAKSESFVTSTTN